MTGTLSATFGDWRDRLTYVVAEAQLLVAGVLVATGLALAWLNPSLPGIPPWVSKLLVGWLVLAPPSFIVGLRFARWLRSRFWPTVYHVNAVTGEREKYHVPPDIWKEKNVNGAAPHRVNDGDDFEVREFDWAPEYGDQGTLTVKGTWLSQVEDAKLVTSKSHFERIHGELQDAFLELTYRRDAEDELANRLQKRIITRVVEAREKGEMLAPDDVNDVVESFKEEMKERTGREELSDITPDDLPDDGRPGLPAGETTNPHADVGMGGSESAATDGGTDQ